MRTLSAVLVALMFASAASANSKLFEPHPQDGKTFAESWTTVVKFEDNTYLHASFMVTNVGLSTGKGLCRAKLMGSGGVRWRREMMVDRDQWKYDSEHAALKIGTCTLTSDAGSTHLMMPLPDGLVDVTLQEAPHPEPMPAKTLHKGERFYDSEVLVPFAKATVRVEKDPTITKTLHGSGFFDHSRSTTLPADIAYGWVRFRGFAPGCSRLVLTRYATRADGVKPPVLESYVWKEGEPHPVMLKAPSAALPDVDVTANQLKISLFDGPNKILVLRGKQLLLKEVPFEENGILGRVVGAFVGSIVLESFEGTLEEEGSKCNNVSGLLEVDHIG